MKCVEKHIEPKYFKPNVPFSSEEKAKFLAYLKRTDKKAGAFTRTAILAAIEREAGFRAENVPVKVAAAGEAAEARSV